MKKMENNWTNYKSNNNNNNYRNPPTPLNIKRRTKEGQKRVEAFLNMDINKINVIPYKPKPIQFSNTAPPNELMEKIKRMQENPILNNNPIGNQSQMNKGQSQSSQAQLNRNQAQPQMNQAQPQMNQAQTQINQAQNNQAQMSQAEMRQAEMSQGQTNNQMEEIQSLPMPQLIPKTKSQPNTQSKLQSKLQSQLKSQSKSTPIVDNQTYYVCSIDPNMNYLISNFLSNISKTYSIYSRQPPKNITEVKANQFTSNKITTSDSQLVVFLYSDPNTTLACNNLWSIAHCSNLMYPKSTDTIFKKFQNDKANILSYLETDVDWLELNEMYFNYLDNKINRSYPIIAVNTDKLWNNLDKFAETLNIPQNQMKFFPNKPIINLPEIKTTMFDQLYNHLKGLNDISVINPNIINGEFHAKLNKKNTLKFKIKSEIAFKTPINIQLAINDSEIKDQGYSYSNEIINENLLQIIIKYQESENKTLILENTDLELSEEIPSEINNNVKAQIKISYSVDLKLDRS